MTTAPLARAATQSVALVLKPGVKEALAAARELLGHLAERKLTALVQVGVADELAQLGALALSEAELAQRADLVVVLGGDGTLIHAARITRKTERPLPILGINLGSLGFMTEVPLAEMRAVLDSVLAGTHRVERRMMLSVELYREGQRILAGEVLNDAVINKGALARIADLEATVDGRRVTTYKADGVIVATPTGSTAYSLAANGPITVPTLEAILVTPICPHTLTQRPLVVPDHCEVEMVLSSDNGEVFLTLDGHTGQALKKGDHLRVRRSVRPMLLVKNPNIDFFGLLRAKLRWGER